MSNESSVSIGRIPWCETHLVSSTGVVRRSPQYLYRSIEYYKISFFAVKQSTGLLLTYVAVAGIPPKRPWGATVADWTTASPSKITPSGRPALSSGVSTGPGSRSRVSSLYCSLRFSCRHALPRCATTNFVYNSLRNRLRGLLLRLP